MSSQLGELGGAYLANGFTLVINSLQANASADVALAKAITLEQQQGPQKEAERQKKEDEELAAARVKNLQSFRP